MLIQYSLGTTQCRTRTAFADSGGSVSYPDNSDLLNRILLHVCNSSILASPTALPHLYFPFLDRGYFGHSKWSKRFFTLTWCVVNICVILSSPFASVRSASSHAEIYFRIPPTWHYLSWCLCGVCHRGSGVFNAFSWYYEHPAYIGFKFPNSIL